MFELERGGRAADHVGDDGVDVAVFDDFLFVGADAVAALRRAWAAISAAA